MAPIAKRRKISFLWNFFSAVDENFASCNLCKSKLSYKTSTTNLKRHMEIKHPSVSLNTNNEFIATSPHEKRVELFINQNNTASTTSVSVPSSQVNTSSVPVVEGDNKVASEPSKISASRPVQVRSYQTNMSVFIPKRLTPKGKQIIDEKLVRLFTDTYQPFRIVEEIAFREFVKALNPTYQLPSRHMISRTIIPALYEKCTNETKEILKSAKKVCITTDCWTSINMESFMAVTIHFLTNNFIPMSLLLECASLPIQHTAINLSNELKRVLTHWNVMDKMLMIVSDNAANIKAAIQNEMGFKHFGCFAHTTNLVVMDGLKEVEVAGILSKVKLIVGHFKRSHVATQKLLAYQQQQNISNPLKILQDVATRWNSTFYMVERFIVLEDAIKTTMALTNMDGAHQLTADEWTVIKELCQVLKPFEKVTKTISGEDYLTASLVIPLSNGLISVYKSFLDKPFSGCIKNLIIRLNRSLGERFGNLENSNTLSISTFLDPRFKSIAFKDKKNADITKKNIISLVAEKFSLEQQASFSENENCDPTKKSNEGDSDDEIWAEFDKEAALFQPIGTSNSKAIIEVQRFLEVEILGRKENPLDWWNQNKYIFPHLALVAQERLSAIATSVPCERQFSKAGQIVTERRSRLGSRKTEMLLFLNSNLKALNMLEEAKQKTII